MLPNNGLEAVEIYKKIKGKYDLILMDLQMPILSGYDATYKFVNLTKIFNSCSYCCCYDRR